MPDTHETKFSKEQRRKPLIILRDTLVNLFITLAGIVVWVYSGAIFHQTLRLFTPLDHTAVNIVSSFAGFVIMASCAVVASYVVRRVGENKLVSGVKNSNTVLPQE